MHATPVVFYSGVHVCLTWAALASLVCSSWPNSVVVLICDRRDVAAETQHATPSWLLQEGASQSFSAFTAQTLDDLTSWLPWSLRARQRQLVGQMAAYPRLAPELRCQLVQDTGAFADRIEVGGGTGGAPERPLGWLARWAVQFKCRCIYGLRT